MVNKQLLSDIVPEEIKVVDTDDLSIEDFTTEYKKLIIKTELADAALDFNEIKLNSGNDIASSLISISEVSGELTEEGLDITRGILESMAMQLGYNLEYDKSTPLLETTEGFFTDVIDALGRTIIRAIDSWTTFYLTIKTRQFRLARMAKKIRNKLSNMPEGDITGQWVSGGSVSDWFVLPKDAVEKTRAFSNLRLASNGLVKTLGTLINADTVENMHERFRDSINEFANLDDKWSEENRKVIKEYADLTNNGMVQISVPMRGNSSHRFVVFSIAMPTINNTLLSEAKKLLVGKGISKLGKLLDTSSAGKYLTKKVFKKAFKIAIPKAARGKLRVSTFFRYGSKAMIRGVPAELGLTLGSLMTPVYWMGTVILFDFIRHSTSTAKAFISQQDMRPLTKKQCHDILVGIESMDDNRMDLSSLAKSMASIQKRLQKSLGQADADISERSAATSLYTTLGQCTSMLRVIYRDGLYEADAATAYVLKSIKVHMNNPAKVDNVFARMTEENVKYLNDIDKLLACLSPPDK